MPEHGSQVQESEREYLRRQALKLAIENGRLRTALTEALDWMEHASSSPEAEQIAVRLRPPRKDSG